MRAYHCYTASGSRYTIRIYPDNRITLEGEATAREHEHGKTRGQKPGIEYPVRCFWPKTPTVGHPLYIEYVPDDLEPGTEYREKQTSLVTRIEIEDVEEETC